MASPKCPFSTEYRQQCAVARNTGIEFSAYFFLLPFFFALMLEVKTEAVSKASKPEHSIILRDTGEAFWIYTSIVLVTINDQCNTVSSNKKN